MNTQRHRSRPNREYTQTRFHILFSECQRSIIAKVENEEEIERNVRRVFLWLFKRSIFNYMLYARGWQFVGTSYHICEESAVLDVTRLECVTSN